jgi:hypothetical protein
LDFDFDRSLDAAWERFSARLGEVVSMMDESEPLTLVPYDADDDRWYVRFVCRDRLLVTALVPGSWAGEPLTSVQEKALADLGFVVVGAYHEKTVEQQGAQDLAATTVAVLRTVFSVEHPVFLGSDVLTDILQEGPVDPSLHQDLTVFMPTDVVQLAAAVAAELTDHLGFVPMTDEDGDFAVRVGSTMLFIRLPTDAREVRLFSVIVHDVVGRSRAAEVLNDVNAHSRWVRFYLSRDKIYATLSVAARPFVPAHLRLALDEMTKVADGVDDLLAASLQGRTTFESPA